MDINLNKVLGDLIRFKRKDCSYSTQQLADKIGVSAGLINNIENAKTDTFNIKLLTSLSDALDIDLSIALSRKYINKNYSINCIPINDDIVNKQNELIYRLTSLINNNSNNINTAHLLDKLLNEIKYFDMLTNPADF